MGTPNQEFTLPELPHHGDRDARDWSEQALAGVILRAYSNAMWTKSRLTDVILNAQPYVPQAPEAVTVTDSEQQAPRAQSEAARWTGSHLTNAQVIPGPDRQPQPQTVAERIQQAKPFIAPQPSTEPYWNGSMAARAAAASYVPDRLSPQDEAASKAEIDRLMAEVDEYRAKAGMPVHAAIQAEAPVTPMQQVEAALPAEDGAYPNYNGTPVDALLEQIGYLHDEQENN